LVKLRPAYVSDGHAVNETLVFWLGDPTASITTSAASDRAVPAEALWRALLQVSLIVYSGALLLYALVLRPVWGNPDLPVPLLRRLGGLLWGSLVVAFGSNIIALLQVSSNLFQTDMATVLRDELWNITLEGTNIGQVWQYRMALLIAMGLIQVMAAQQAANRPTSRHVLWVLNAGLSLLALLTLTLISHAAGADLWREWSVLADYLHLVAVAFWVGSLVLIVLVLRPALTPLPAAQRGPALQALLGRFSPLAALAIGLIITTGLYSSAMRLDSPASVVNSTYGITWLSKMILIVPAFALGGLHHLTLFPHRAGRLREWFSQPRRWANLPSTLRLEVALIVAVLFAAAWLPATPPPEPSQARREVVIQTQELTVAEYKITLAISPGAVGANSYDVTLTDSLGLPLVLEEVRLRFSYPASGRYSPPLVLEQADLNLWVGASGDLDQSARWDVLIDFSGPAIQSTRAAFQWSVAREVADPNPRRPTWLHLLTAFSMVAVVVGGVGPSLYQWGRKAKWDGASLAIGLSSSAALVVILVGGMWYFDVNRQRVREQRSTPPEVVNPILADQTSVEQGRWLYQVHCSVCHASDGQGNPPIALNLSRLTPNLPTVLSQQADADLLRLLQNGIVNRHRYSTDLSDEQHWHLINFLRSLE
jgi:copper transport protein